MTCTPMMQQWQNCKQQVQDALLLFRLGDFYEAFEQDASILAKELDLVLTKRQDIPMAGIPFHTVEVYIDRLIAKGFRVAVAEQMEDPKTSKGLVKRQIVRIVTPGSVIQSSLLDDKSHNFMACLITTDALYGLAVIDLTTSYFKTMESPNLQDLLNELARLEPKELLLSEKSAKELSIFLKEFQILSYQIKQQWQFDYSLTYDSLLNHFQLPSLDGWGLKGMTAAIQAAGSLINYLKEDLNLNVSHIKTLYPYHTNSYLLLDRDTQKHLEILTPLHDKGKTLLSTLDLTVTPMGGRLLKDWLLHPLVSISEIQARQELIELFLENRTELQIYLKEVKDLERLTMRIETGYALPRDLVALRLSLEMFPWISECCLRLKIQALADLTDLTTKLQKALVDNPPLKITEGGIFKEGYDETLDSLKRFKANNQEWIVSYQTKLREQTQIKTLKIAYTQAFGYYIEVSRGQSDKMPDSFQRKQTLVNTERFTSPELKEFEHAALTVEEKIHMLEADLFHRLRKEISQAANEIRQSAQWLAHIDVCLALSQVARNYHYVKPILEDSDQLEIKEGRHPVIDALVTSKEFIPNSVDFNTQERLHVITGPNMAGKSTFIRQVALIVLLAQIGSFVPAKSARIGIIDKLFTRIGASDDLSRGQSTFMIEMSETANILHNVTSRSLVILDEIGRGTSTYDGIAIAWSVAEFLLTTPGKMAKTLFATHYFELTRLAKEIPGAVNYHVCVEETKKGIVFLHKIARGSTNKSYGIHVAKLAGLPDSVINRAEKILDHLHSKQPSSQKKNHEQFLLF